MPVSAAAPSSGDCGSVKPTPFLPGPPLPSSTLQEEPPNPPQSLGGMHSVELWTTVWGGGRAARSRREDPHIK